MDARSQARIQEIKKVIAERSPQPLSQEAVSICMDFVVAYKSEINPLPVDPVALLLAYESYQNELAEEAAEIHWLESGLEGILRRSLREAVDSSAHIIGCGRQDAGDSLALLARGIINRVVRGMSKW